jgi:hypothetical protein
MVPPTRRRAIRGVAASLLGALAGCATDTSPDFDAPTGPQNVETDPAHLMFRHPTGERPVRVAESQETERRPGPTAEDRRQAARSGVVASPETAALLRFADVEGATAARQFVENTDFSAETLYVDHSPVAECYRLHLCAVAWAPGEIDVQYTRRYRDWDVACGVDSEDAVACLIRVPAVLDPGEVSQFGSGYRSGACPRARERPSTTRTATDTDDTATSRGESG